MRERQYEYYYDRVRTIEGGTSKTIGAANSYFNPPLSFQPPQQHYVSGNYSIPLTRFPGTSAATALEQLDRGIHAGLAVVPITGRQSTRFNTTVHSPRPTSDRRDSKYIRTNRGGQILLSSKKSKKSESRYDRRFCKDYPCRNCSRGDVLERQCCAVKTRLYMALRPPSSSSQKETGGNRC